MHTHTYMPGLYYFRSPFSSGIFWDPGAPWCPVGRVPAIHDVIPDYTHSLSCFLPSFYLFSPPHKRWQGSERKRRSLFSLNDPQHTSSSSSSSSSSQRCLKWYLKRRVDAYLNFACFILNHSGTLTIGKSKREDKSGWLWWGDLDHYQEQCQLDIFKAERFIPISITMTHHGSWHTHLFVTFVS